MSKAADKFSSFASGAAKAIAGATTAIATGLGTIGKLALDNYADYEQLVGGVETLFKDGSDALMEYAKTAYKNAGVSANDYMKSVTSFAASLIQSLDGDTGKAVEYANTAMVDMSDNVNKMGTDMEMVQNAYNGFAKGEYRMLDNLKLGYSGSQEAMEQLIADAAANTEAQERLGVTVDATSLSFANIVQAIHVVQSELGILGTTEQEAATTISGSIGMLKASFEDLLTGFGNADADIGTLCDNVITSFEAVVNNVSPIVENIIQAMPDALSVLIDAIGDMLPDLLTTVAELFNEALAKLIELIPELIPAATQAIDTLITGLTDNLPALIQAAIQVIGALVGGLIQALPQIVPAALQAIMTLAQGLVDSIPQMMESATEVIIQLAKMLTEPSMLYKLYETALTLLKNLAEGLVLGIPQLIHAASDIIIGFNKYALSPDNLREIVAMALELVINIANGIILAIPELLVAAVRIVAEFIKAIVTTDWVEVGKNIVFGILDGLVGAWKTLVEWFEDAWDNLVDDVCDLLGIHSPSKVFAEIGKNMALGVGEGWEDEFGDIKDGIEDGMTFESAVNASGSNSRGGSHGINVTQNIYAQKMSPSEVFAEAKYQQTRAVLFGV